MKWIIALFLIRVGWCSGPRMYEAYVKTFHEFDIKWILKNYRSKKDKHV